MNAAAAAPASTHGAGRPGGVWAPERRALTVGLILVITLVAFESLAVSTVMTAVARDLGGLALYGWAFSAFFLGNLVGIVVAGLLIDRYGPLRPFLLGTALFALGLAIDGSAPTMELLVLGRLVQGFGGAAVPTVAYVSIGRAYPESARPRMFALMSSAWVVPGFVGPGLAGLVAQSLTWRLVFLGLVPFVVVGAVLTASALRTLGGPVEAAGGAGPGTDPVPGPGEDARRRVLLALGVAAGAGLLLGAGTAPTPPVAAVLAIGGIALGLPTLVRLLPTGTLRAARGIPSVVLARGASTFSFFGAEAFVPLALVSIRGLSFAASGLLLTAVTVTWTAGSWTQAHLVARVGQPRLIRAGFACVTFGLLGAAAILVPAVPLAAVAAVYAIGGFGMGLLYSTIAQLILLEAPVAEHGAASASLQLSDVLGSALGTGLAGAFVAYGTLAGLPPTTGLGAAFGASIAVAALGVVVAGRLVPAEGLAAAAPEAAAA